MNSGIIIFTDGVFGTTDAGLLEILLSQLRHNTISCSFVQVILFVFEGLNWINYHHQTLRTFRSEVEVAIRHRQKVSCLITI